MPVTTSYRLPGVYSEDRTGPFVSATVSGDAVLALVGPSRGYLTASSQAVMSGDESISFEESGVIEGSASIRSRLNGVTFENGDDFIQYTDLDGVTSVRRRLQTLPLERRSVINYQKTYYTSEQIFSIMRDAQGGEVSGYPICGTVSVYDISASPDVPDNPDDTDDTEPTGDDTEPTGDDTEPAGDDTEPTGDDTEPTGDDTEPTGDDTEPVVQTDVLLVEGVDYEIDYIDGTLAALSGGRLATSDANGHELLISYDYTEAEPVILVGESAYVLKHSFISENGLNGDSAIIVSGVYSDGDVHYEWGSTPGSDDPYEEGVDFVIDYQTGRISRTADSRIPSFSSALRNYMYVSFAYCAIRDGESVAIEYAYQDDDYGIPQIVSSYAEMASVFGAAWDVNTGDIVSPLSMATYLAFQNGAPYVYVCPVRGTVNGSDMSVTYSPSAWEEAFTALSRIDGIDIVVPITDDVTSLSFATAHVVQMKANMDERVLIVGLDGTSDNVTDSTLLARARGFSSADVWLVGPGTFRFRNPIRNTIDVVPGYYMAAAVGGYNSSVPQYTPLTRKIVSGFYSANEYATKLSKTNLCANGVMYVDEVNGQMRILHGTSTNVASIVPRETNITLCKYFIIKSLRETFEEGYVGELITNTTLANVEATVFALLTDMVEDNYMYSFDQLSVSVNSNIPTQVDISFIYRPVFSMNYIQISFAIDTSTGESSIEEAY